MQFTLRFLVLYVLLAACLANLSADRVVPEDRFDEEITSTNPKEADKDQDAVEPSTATEQSTALSEHEENSSTMQPVPKSDLVATRYHSDCLENTHSHFPSHDFRLRGPNGKWCRMDCYCHSCRSGTRVLCDRDTIDYSREATFNQKKATIGGWKRDVLAVRCKNHFWVLSDRGATHQVEVHKNANGPWESFQTLDNSRTKVYYPSNMLFSPEGKYVWEYSISFKGGREGHKCRLHGTKMRCNGGTSSHGWRGSSFAFTAVYDYDLTHGAMRRDDRCPAVTRGCALSGNCLSGSASTIEWFSNRGETCQNAWSKGINGNAGQNSVHRRCPDWAGTGRGAWNNEHYKACRDQIMAQRGGQCNPQEVEGLATI